MKTSLPILVAATLVAGAFSALSRTQAVNERAPVAVARPLPGGVQRIVSATPFLLERGWTHEWRAEKPRYDAGWLLVLEVDPGFVQPTQLEEPVLYAGSETVERMNHGARSGRVVAILPSTRTRAGGVALDLATTPIWFGGAFLPERVDAARIERERARADALGVRPLAMPAIGAPLSLGSRDDLDPLAGELILQHDSFEADTGLGLLAPRLK